MLNERSNVLFSKDVFNTTDFNHHNDSVSVLFGLFFIYVSDNIDRTINRQMYEMIMNRQEPIAEMIQSNEKSDNENVYAFLSLDTVQTNCIIKNGKMEILSNQKNQFVNPKSV